MAKLDHVVTAAAVHQWRRPYIHLLFTRNGSNKKRNTKKENKKYTNIKSESMKNQYAL